MASNRSSSESDISDWTEADDSDSSSHTSRLVLEEINATGIIVISSDSSSDDASRSSSSESGSEYESMATVVTTSDSENDYEEGAFSESEEEEVEQQVEIQIELQENDLSDQEPYEVEEEGEERNDEEGDDEEEEAQVYYTPPRHQEGRYDIEELPMERPGNHAPQHQEIDDEVEELPLELTVRFPEAVVMDENVASGASAATASTSSEPVASDANVDVGTKNPKTAKKRSAQEMEDSGDDEQRCPICFESWSGSGEHRLCSLACGHLFGKSCIEKWITTGAMGRRCPQCNRACKKSDIRQLYASAVRVKEVSAEEKLQKQLDQTLKEKRELEVRLMRTELRMVELTELQKKELPEPQQLPAVNAAPAIPAVRPGGKKLIFQFAKDISLGLKGGGRVMSYCPWTTQLCVSQMSKLCGFGVVQLHCERNFLPLCRETIHTKMIRDVACCPEQANTLLLTASLDRTAKLIDYRSRFAGSVQTYKVDAPLWSCCWDLTSRVGTGSTYNVITVGMTSGVVAKFDLRMVNQVPVTCMSRREDQSPVSSLVSLPPGCCPSLPRGGLIVSQLTTCRLYVGDNDPEGTILPFQSPLLCVRAEGVSGHILVSTRASNGHPTTHTVYRLSRDPNVPPQQLFESVLTIQGAMRQDFLTRPCIARYKENDLIVAAHQEESMMVPLWSVSTGSRIASLPTNDDILDIANFSVNANDYYALAADKNVMIYKYQ